MRLNASRLNIERGIQELGDGTKLLQSGPPSQPSYVRSSYVSDQRDVRRFTGKRVAVVGAGQSALESAALIHEAGGDVEAISDPSGDNNSPLKVSTSTEGQKEVIRILLHPNDFTASDLRHGPQHVPAVSGGLQDRIGLQL